MWMGEGLLGRGIGGMGPITTNGGEEDAPSIEIAIWIKKLNRRGKGG